MRPPKLSPATATLTPAQRRAAIDAAPAEPGDHAIGVDGGAVVVVRVDDYGRRIVALDLNPARALRAARAPRDLDAMRAHDHRRWRALAELTGAKVRTSRWGGGRAKPGDAEQMKCDATRHDTTRATKAQPTLSTQAQH